MFLTLALHVAPTSNCTFSPLPQLMPPWFPILWQLPKGKFCPGWRICFPCHLLPFTSSLWEPKVLRTSMGGDCLLLAHLLFSWVSYPVAGLCKRRSLLGSSDLVTSWALSRQEWSRVLVLVTPHYAWRCACRTSSPDPVMWRMTWAMT